MSMKKLLIMLLCLSAWSVNNAYAEDVEIDLSVEIVDETTCHPGREKAPLRIPRVYQDGYKLTLSRSHPEYIINIVQDDVVVYSSVIPAGVTEFNLPSYLSGECRIQLISGRLCFYGQIIL